MPPTRNWTGEVLLWTQIMGMRPLMAAIPVSRKLSISATVSAMAEGIVIAVVVAGRCSYRSGNLEVRTSTASRGRRCRVRTVLCYFGPVRGSLMVAVADSSGPVVGIVLLSLSKHRNFGLFVCSNHRNVSNKAAGHPELQGRNMAVDGCGHAFLVAGAR